MCHSVSEVLRRLLMPISRLTLTVPLLVFPLATAAQVRPTSSDQRSIEISATEKIQAIAEIATIKLGYQNQAPTKDAAYTENTRMANKIIQAVLEAGVPKASIETETLSLEQDQNRYGARPEQPRTYTATQQWLIHCAASEAQKIVDIAVGAGANQIENVEWSVADPKQLVARAYAAAIKRARELAEQTASQTGLKLGDIISVVNSTNIADRFIRAGSGGGEKVVAPKMAMLELQPGTVEREASVTVTYAIVP